MNFARENPCSPKYNSGGSSSTEMIKEVPALPAEENHPRELRKERGTEGNDQDVSSSRSADCGVF